MADYFEYSAGHIIAEMGGRKALDTSVPMLNLVPSAAITLTDYAISWPDLFSGTIFEQVRQTIESPPSVFNDYFGCSTWIGLVEQEWGPSEPSPRTLADISLGTVPAGTDYLEIWVNLSRTVNPAKILDLALASNFPEGEWVKLDGYSCVVEEFGGVARQFEFVLDGTSVKLRRYQSVNKDGGLLPGTTRVNPSEDIGNATFFYAGTNAPEDGSKYAIYGQMIQQLGPDRNIPTHRPSGKEAGSASNVPCSMSHAGISYASTWTGDIIIKPGFIDA
ncbi:hypothetical protein [Devosia sp. Root635]|uniref:hypothetical protein n=1 Tax=Devosia sp. Root635 TaxID=1736575 RepID=UPI0006F95823|nr:hypothetical protein [Devosia sp. Root635]KRA42086.1 hypothetical protein ASD80_10185 [Devosia sp. Root635]